MSMELTLIAVIFFVVIGLVLSALILCVKETLVTTALCRILINDDDKLTKEVKGGKTLLTLLADEGIALPSPCGGRATCKQCKVRVIEGGGEVLETDKATFTPKEIREGWRLSCQCKVKNDLKIKVPESFLTLREFFGTVISNENVATFIKELVLEVPSREPITYVPGDYLQFHVPPFATSTESFKETIGEEYREDWEKFGMFGHEISFEAKGEEVVRAYSMASHPAEGDQLMFNVRIASPPLVEGKVSSRIPWGICSSYLFSLQGGEKVRLSGPFGESHMIEDERELIFLIGGAGSSFGRSHILDLFLTKKTKRKVTLWYGARSLKENIYQEEFEELEKSFPNFTYKLVLSEPTDEDLKGGWPKEDPLKTNYLFRAFEKGQLEKMEEPEECLYYVCGPPLHNKSVMELLDNYGVVRENIILDDFGS